MTEFTPFSKIARFHREITITEKIDGTNAQVFVDEELNVRAGSRSRWITPEDDNYGFAKWVLEHTEELQTLGPGQHFGEWWGLGIQRNYSQTEKRFSLFNTNRWTEDTKPTCCSVVPVLYQGILEPHSVPKVISSLRKNGSVAAPGFMKPEGIVIWHDAARIYFKATLENDEKPKGSKE